MLRFTEPGSFSDVPLSPAAAVSPAAFVSSAFVSDALVSVEELPEPHPASAEAASAAASTNAKHFFIVISSFVM